MIDFIVRMIFKWPSLRLAIFDEVNWYNSLGLIFEDPEAMKTAAAFWWEPDGWRGWQEHEGKYYFHDIPEPTIGDILDAVNRGVDNEA
mgnify:CR=1 FL=1